MRAFLLPSLLATLLGLPALAQAPSEPLPANPVPDESWLSYPGPESPMPPADTLPAAPLPLPASSPSQVSLVSRVSRVGRVSTEALEPSRVSLFGGKLLEPGKLAASVVLGFPLASARLSMGVLPRVDASVGLDSLYGIMNEVRAGVRFNLLPGEQAQLAFSLEGGHAFFLNSPSQEQYGARYFTGHRNWNLAPGLMGSMVVGRKTRGFLDVRYMLAFDTQPFQRDPLGGVPPGVQVGSNLLFRGGLEVALSEQTSYVVTAGGNIQGRQEDAAFMPAVGVGVVTGF